MKSEVLTVMLMKVSLLCMMLCDWASSSQCSWL